ncbi:MAG: zf-HC2 domain-containing protein [Phycisphaerae bacterium]|nr:zf-HC2 domain-containing protein [Phycisphaerae bacterium]
MSELTCRELIDFLDDYFAGALAREQREIFDRHLAFCPDCVAYLKTYADTVELVRKSCDECPEQSASSDVPEDLIQAILSATRRPS